MKRIEVDFPSFDQLSGALLHRRSLYKLQAYCLQRQRLTFLLLIEDSNPPEEFLAVSFGRYQTTALKPTKLSNFKTKQILN